VTTAETAVNAAQNRYEQAKAGSPPEQIAQAEAAVRGAEGQLALAKAPATENDLKSARAAVAAAEAQFALAKTPITPQDLEAAEAGVAQAQAAVDLAKLQLGEATVKAPFDGVVAQRLVSEGAMAGPTAPVVTLISTETEVVVNVEEASLGAIKLGQSATLTATAYPGVEFAAAVASIAPNVDAKSRTSLVRLAPKDPDGKLRDGMFAQVRLATDDATASGLSVPKTAVVQQGGDSVAFVVADGRAQRRVVTLGAGDGERLRIVEGLKAGEQVAISGVADLRDGANVAVAQ
jgi:membrane fusion protein (multidrug efflux system)